MLPIRSNIMVTMTLWLLVLLTSHDHHPFGVSGEALQDGFEDRHVVSVDDPTDLAFAPSRVQRKHQVLLVEKTGQVHLVSSDTLDGLQEESNRKVVLDMSDVLCTNTERGISGIAFDPDYGNPDTTVDGDFVYVYYTFNRLNECEEESENGPVNRLSRFRLSSVDYENPIIKRETEQVLLTTPTLKKPYHNGGDIHFGTSDGYLYMTIGDAGDTGSQQRLNNLLGTIVRITKDGKVPPDNPFAESGAPCFETGLVPGSRLDQDNGDVCAEILSYGLRNPWRMAMDPNTVDTVRFWINDVGNKYWEEINEGGTAPELMGVNYGYPQREGPCERNQFEGCVYDSDDYQEPLHYYYHDPNMFGTDDRAITAGAFLPNGNHGWPASYDDTYLFADYPTGRMYAMSTLSSATDDDCRDCNPPRSNKEILDFAEYDRIVSMVFYESTLFYLSRAGQGELRRIRYIPEDQNIPPRARVVVQHSTDGATASPVGTMVTLDASSSTDDDGSIAGYGWLIYSDGNNEPPDVRMGATTTVTFDKAGVYRVDLTITDDQMGQDTLSTTVAIGTEPTTIITSPAAGTLFAVGDRMTLTASATDENDATNRSAIPDASLEWEVRQHHGTHFHPFLDPTSGNNILLQKAPAPEDYFAATNSYLEVVVTATDSLGLSSTASINVMPKAVELELVSIPSGLTVYLDSSPLVLPATALTWENQALPIEAPNQGNFAWTNWSDGKDQSHVFTVPAANSSTGSVSAMVMQFEETLEFIVVSATASSGDAMLAVDGDSTTLWESDAAGQEVEQQLVMDLGAVRKITTLELQWGSAAFAKQYKIDTSPDANPGDETFVESFVEFSGNGGADVAQLPAGTVARFIRVTATESSTGDGRYTLGNVAVKGILDATATPTISPTISPPQTPDTTPPTASSIETTVQIPTTPPPTEVFTITSTPPPRNSPPDPPGSTAATSTATTACVLSRTLSLFAVAMAAFFAWCC